MKTKITLTFLALLVCVGFSAQQTINLGTAPNGATGDNNRQAWTKANANFTELYTALENDIVLTPPAARSLVAVDEADAATSLLINDKTGTHASPSTANPLAPTWTGLMHVVYYGATGEIDLPAAAGYAGRSILIYSTGAFTVTIDPSGSEVIVRDGTVQTGGVTMTLSSGAGNFVALISDGARWITLGYKGTLAAGS